MRGMINQSIERPIHQWVSSQVHTLLTVNGVGSVKW